MFNLKLQNSPQKIGVWWVARLKVSISLENFKILKKKNNLWALRDGEKKKATAIAKRYGECSEALVFLGKKRGRKTVRGE